MGASEAASAANYWQATMRSKVDAGCPLFSDHAIFHKQWHV